MARTAGQIKARGPETCAICECPLHRGGKYGGPSVAGRSHATKHHFVAERFFGRSKNRRGEERKRIFDADPWGVERETTVLCFDCHEELLHNPVLLARDLENLRELVRLRGLNENKKSRDRQKLADRIELLHEALDKGLRGLLRDERAAIKAGR